MAKTVVPCGTREKLAPVVATAAAFEAFAETSCVAHTDNAAGPKSYDYAALWQDLAENRDHVPSHLAEAAGQLDMTAWPAPVILEFLGKWSSAQTLAAATDNDPKTRLGRTCEANFYGGEFALLKKKGAEGLRQLRLAARDCPRSFIESTAAIAELIVQR